MGERWHQLTASTPAQSVCLCCCRFSVCSIPCHRQYLVHVGMYMHVLRTQTLPGATPADPAVICRPGPAPPEFRSQFPVPTRRSGPACNGGAPSAPAGSDELPGRRGYCVLCISIFWQCSLFLSVIPSRMRQAVSAVRWDPPQRGKKRICSEINAGIYLSPFVVASEKDFRWNGRSIPTNIPARPRFPEVYKYSYGVHT
jgi:hypothetical protein